MCHATKQGVTKWDVTHKPTKVDKKQLFLAIAGAASLPKQQENQHLKRCLSPILLHPVLWLPEKSSYRPQKRNRCADFFRAIFATNVCADMLPEYLTVKEFYFMVRRICPGFLKFLAADFPGNRRTKIGEVFRQNFAAFFAHISEIFTRISLSGLFGISNFRPQKRNCHADCRSAALRLFLGLDIFPHPMTIHRASGGRNKKSS